MVQFHQIMNEIQNIIKRDAVNGKLIPTYYVYAQGRSKH